MYLFRFSFIIALKSSCNQTLYIYNCYKIIYCGCPLHQEVTPLLSSIIKITITSITSTFIIIILVTFHFHNLPIIFMLMSCLWLTFCMPLCYTINRGIRVHIVYTWILWRIRNTLISCLYISIVFIFYISCLILL